MLDPTRLRLLNDLPPAKGQYVLYWMQASQRTRFNHALEYAIHRANELALPLIVCFGLTDNYPEANLRHYAFMLQGLRDVQQSLNKRGIHFVIRRNSPPLAAIELSKNAALIVCDRGYLRHQKQWRDHVADHAKCQVAEVESDVVVPVDEVSDHAEFTARTIRPKIRALLPKYLVNPKSHKPRHSSLKLNLKSDVDLSDHDSALRQLKLNRDVPPSTRLTGGQTEAKKLLDHFLRSTLSRYGEQRNDPCAPATSMLGAYLHFGQISPLEAALAIAGSSALEADREAFLEQLIVRRELSINFVNFNPDYDQYTGLPSWSRQALAARLTDKRSYVYSRQEFENAKTHDPYWNAAQLEMTHTGYLHNSMRMYWGKKFLEWKQTPEEAYSDAIYLNNKYFLCGRDPNSYASIGWLFGLHDRPWTPRPIFGTVRYMNAGGLERKFDVAAYVKTINERFVQSK